MHRCITSYSVFTSKDIYNQTLDTRIILLYSISKEKYTAKELCDILLQSNQNIFEVWKEEDAQVTEKRFHYFTIGSKQFLTK